MSAKAIVVLVLALLAIVGVVWYTVHERGRGAEICQHDDLTAAQKEIDRYKVQLDYANTQLEKDENLLRAIAKQPVTHLVCHQAGTKPAPAQVSSNSPAAGVPDPVRGSDFDPSEDLRNLFAGYEGRAETARDALNRCLTK